MNLDDYRERLKEIEQFERDGERAEGRLEECLRRLSADLGTDDLAKAKRVLARRVQELEKRERDLESKYHQWDQRWKHKLEELS